MLQIGGFCGAWRSGGLGLHLDWGQSQASLSQKPEAQPGSMRAHRGLELRIPDLLGAQAVPRDSARTQSRGLGGWIQ